MHLYNLEGVSASAGECEKATVQKRPILQRFRVRLKRSKAEGPVYSKESADIEKSLPGLRCPQVKAFKPPADSRTWAERLGTKEEILRVLELAARAKAHLASANSDT